MDVVLLEGEVDDERGDDELFDVEGAVGLGDVDDLPLLEEIGVGGDLLEFADDVVLRDHLKCGLLA